jgi:hypothetical protein
MALCHDQRIGLDGEPAEAVDAEAKDLAANRLAQLAARKATKPRSRRRPLWSRRSLRPCNCAPERVAAFAAARSNLFSVNESNKLRRACEQSLSGH